MARRRSSGSARLSAEHRTVARILADIRILTEDGDPVLIGDELDRLAGELEAHLDYEEEQLVPVLNQLTDMPDNI
ncbi:MAG TPA: hemerythrin domain-containing protein [Pseudonocardiaceae bacterium]|nr:hemerythrin domain-containing protein [Pseudonocardiaceae bacterium]